MFKKILIANRGEIACRAMRTAKKMGIATVAVYSDADRTALHTLSADEAINIGPAPSAESYLRIDAIIEACKASGADAVYPGYGFLSENSRFAAALEEANIEFIGPGRHAIESMGDKITSKKLAIEAGVSTVPGHTDIITDGNHAVRIALDIGFPVMLKASAGGGGKGMRVAYDEAECREGFERASNEARSSFGDDRIFIEKFIEQPRHIEIQVLADKRGNTLYLHERECSIQRRHQKVIEEAPSPFLDQKTREAMGEQACALARAVDYHSAGTVEFIVDSQRNFYFLEMNTRLQVEHPVTEMITGLDLVEQMIRVANGEALGITQSDIKIDGWAMEARIYAENPLREFLPSTGRLIRYVEPLPMDNGSESVRVDTGVYEGGEVSIYYDPMISKLVTHGPDRAAAIASMESALDRYIIGGVTTNIPFLAALFAHEDFRSGDISTNFIDLHYPGGFNILEPSSADQLKIDVTALITHHLLQRRAASISDVAEKSVGSHSTDYVVVEGDRYFSASLAQVSSGEFHITHEDATLRIKTDWQPANPVFEATLNEQPFVYQWSRSARGYQIANGSYRREMLVMSPRAAELNRYMPVRKEIDTSKFLLSPMPGLLMNVLVSENDTVTAGDPLAVVEAMKMENVLKAERGGTIEKIFEQTGATLDVDQKILEFK